MRYLIPVTLFTILLLFFWVGLSLNPGEIPSPLIGKPAPAFELPTLRSPERSLGSQDLLGEVALINVWATWCVGCRQEHDTLLKIAESAEVPIYGLNWKDDRGRALQWLAQLGDPYRANAFDADGRVAIDWGVYGAPETFLVDAAGIIRYKHIGPLTLDIWQNELLPAVLRARETAGGG